MVCKNFVGDVLLLVAIIAMLLIFIKSVGRHARIEVEGEKVKRKHWLVRLFCYHHWAVHLPYDHGWICFKCGGRQFAE